VRPNPGGIPLSKVGDLMLKMTQWAMTHRRAVVAAWILLAAGLFAAAHRVGSSYSNSLTLSGTGSQQASNLLQNRYPAAAGDTDRIVFQSRTGKVTDPADRQTINGTVARVARLPHVTAVVSPFSTGGRALSKNGRVAFATVQFDENAGALPNSAVDNVISTAQQARSRTLNVQLGGQAIQNSEKPSTGLSVIAGLVAAAIILALSFGSLVAMSLPIISAVVGVLVGVALIELASQFILMPNFAPDLGVMIGLGVGVDYALFIVTRFRENYRSNGGDVDAAVTDAFNTAGRAVLFAAVTVVVALLGMFALGVSLLDGLGIAAALGVVAVLGASMTLLPSLLRLTGHRFAVPPAGSQPGFWTRWCLGVQRHPALVALVAVMVMLVVASPTLGLRLGLSDGGNFPTSDTSRQAFDLVASNFGAGSNGPLQVAVALPVKNDTGAVRRFADALRTTPGIAGVARATISPGATAASIVAIPTTSPQSTETKSLVNRLRDRVLPPIERSTGARAFVGGATATDIDFAHVLASKLPVFIAIVIGLGCLLLMIVFRSLVIPFQAALMNVLTIGAALGVSTLVFQHGWLGGLLNLRSGPIDAYIPVVAFAIIFGLSTDYEVFLVSRIREEWQLGHRPRAALTQGMGSTARVVVSAAAVMCCVFAAFALSGFRQLAEFGLVLAVGVFFDVLLNRLLLLPAILHWLDERTWKLPPRLERRLPHITIEPAPVHSLDPTG
jgi:putative drug exporter of the RND superfamily